MWMGLRMGRRQNDSNLRMGWVLGVMWEYTDLKIIPLSAFEFKDCIHNNTT